MEGEAVDGVGAHAVDGINNDFRPSALSWAQVKGRAIDMPTVRYRAILHGRHVNSTSIAQ